VIILGLNAWHADASCALLVDGELVVAVEEERLNRVKHCAGFPAQAARACLRQAGVRPDQIDHLAISRDPKANLLRKLGGLISGAAPPSMLASRLGNAQKVVSVEERLAEALGVRQIAAPLHNVEHHRAHLASAFLCSPFEEAAVLSVDGFGDFVSTMWAVGRGNGFEVLGQIGFPHSLGILYTAVTQWLGFDKYGDEGKVMGLAPYGQPRFASVLRDACHPKGDGFELDLEWFTHASEGVAMTWDQGTPSISRLWSQKFLEELGPARERGQPLTDLHHDVAASLQAITEEIVIHLARSLQRRTGMSNLCLAGGVALNSVANGKLRAQTEFRDIFVQPAAGDNGTSLGAALFVEHMVLGRPRRYVMEHAYTGPGFSDDECEQALARARLSGTKSENVVGETADAIAKGEVVGWFQGRMEFGPRALGNRSVLADPRRADMKDILNRRIKHREPFRPFAPAILAERASEWFLDAQPSPAMLMVLPFRPEKRALAPAVVHVDGSGRLQTVERAHNPRFYDLIAAFDKLTGVPIILNTSFNENEPIVCTPDEALACFQRTQMDRVVLGSWVVHR
jgi:carbamoyltransferase